jgi:hypothetical protein
MRIARASSAIAMAGGETSQARMGRVDGMGSWLRIRAD